MDVTPKANQSHTFGNRKKGAKGWSVLSPCTTPNLAGRPRKRNTNRLQFNLSLCREKTKQVWNNETGEPQNIFYDRFNHTTVDTNNALCSLTVGVLKVQDYDKMVKPVETYLALRFARSLEGVAGFVKEQLSEHTHQDETVRAFRPGDSWGRVLQAASVSCKPHKPTSNTGVPHPNTVYTVNSRSCRDSRKQGRRSSVLKPSWTNPTCRYPKGHFYRHMLRLWRRLARETYGQWCEGYQQRKRKRQRQKSKP